MITRILITIIFFLAFYIGLKGNIDEENKPMIIAALFWWTVTSLIFSFLLEAVL